MKFISVFFIACMLLVLCAASLSGCIAQNAAPTAVSSTPIPETATRVHHEGFYNIDGPARSVNPVITMVTLEMTNIGDFDAKNVKAHVKLIFNGNTLDEDTIYFGTVKVGMPVKKEFLMKAQFSANDWADYQTVKYNGIQLVTDSVTGDNLLNSTMVAESDNEAVIDFTIYDDQDRPIVTTNKKLYDEILNKGSTVFYSMPLKVAVNGITTTNVTRIPVVYNQYQTYFGLFKDEMNLIEKGVSGMKVNEQKRISLVMLKDPWRLR